MEYWQILREKLGSQKLIMTGIAAGIFHGGKILLVFHKGFQQWQIPGCIQDLDESITDTAEREVFEELNLRLRPGELVSVYTSPEWDVCLRNGHEIQQFLLFFKMEGAFEPDDIRIQKSEIERYGFFSLDDFPENILPCCRQKCEDLRDYRGRVIFR